MNCISAEEGHYHRGPEAHFLHQNLAITLLLSSKSLKLCHACGHNFLPALLQTPADYFLLGCSDASDALHNNRDGYIH